MELMAERWTEERLDDLKGQVEKLERRTDAGFRELRQEMDRRFDKVDGRFDKVDGRFDKVDGRFDKVDGRFDKVDGRFDKVDGRFDKVDGRFEVIERRFDLIDGRFEAIHRTLILFLASMFAAMIGLVATLVATQL